MISRILFPAVPVAVILAALVWHSLGALPRWRAVAFWVSAVAYGSVLRFSQSATEVRAGDPLLWVGGLVIVLYLAWWIGGRWTYLVAQVALASMFLGAFGWAIDGAAGAWNVPGLGAVESFFAGIDFLLPFAAITGRWRWRWWTLLFLPVHVAGHILPGVYLDLVHGAIVLIVAAVALRTTVEHKPFSDARSWVPTAVFGSIMIALAVAAVTAGRSRLLISLVPAVVIWVSVLLGLRLRWLRRHWAVALIAIVLAAAVWVWT